MTMMKKIILLIISCIFLCLAALAEAAPIEGVRSSITPSKIRLVLDSKAAIKYKLTQGDRLITVDLPQSSAKLLKPVLKDPLIESIALKPAGKNSSRLQITLTKKARYYLFTLAKPHRLVVDIYKIAKTDQKKKVKAGVEYRFLQDEVAGRQLRAHVVSVAPNARYELRPFFAGGAYNSRGSLQKRASELALPAAINASYFDFEVEGWVIGVTKDRGKLLTMDATPRSAFIIKGGKPAIVKDVAYNAYLELKNGQRVPVKGMNRARTAEDCVLYNDSFGPSTRTNRWGREIKLKDGLVTALSTLGNMKLEPGEVVLSGHGAMAQLLMNVRVDQRLRLVESLTNEEAAEAETVLSAGPLLLEKGRVNVRIAEEQIARDIAVGRAPRTAVGLKEDGTALLVVVDGRSSQSSGLTLEELANFLLKLGAKDAVNLDGGGSSEMVINGKIVNQPSNGKERLVSICLGLFPK